VAYERFSTADCDKSTTSLACQKKLANQKTGNNLPRISPRLGSQPSEASNAPNRTEIATQDFPIRAENFGN
jgi:hypothetical protein